MTIHNSSNSSLNSTQEDKDLNLFSLLDVILDSKRLIIYTTIIIVALTVAYAFLSAPVYEANTLIQVEKSEGASNGSAIGEMASLFDLESPASAEMEILRSRLVVGKATDQLQLYISAEPSYIPIVGRWLSKRAKTLSTPGIFGFGGYVSGTESIRLSIFEVPRNFEGEEFSLITSDDGFTLNSPTGEKLVEGFLKKEALFNIDGEPGRILVDELNAKPGAKFNLVRASRLRTITDLQQQLKINEQGKQSGMIMATLEGINPDQTSAVLNAVGAAYVHQNIARKAAEAEKSLVFLDSFLPQLKKQMQQAEEQYTKFRDVHGTFNLGAEGEMSLQASAELQAKLLELEQKRRELAPRFKPAHPAIQTLDSQISGIHKELARIEANVKKMPDMEQQLLSLMRNVQVNSEMYVNLLNSAQQLRLVKEGKVGNVRVVDPAAVPEVPVKPKRPLLLILSIVIGLIIGIALAFLRSWLRPGITNPTDIESNLGLHVFTAIPHSPAQVRLYNLVKQKAPGLHVLAQTAPQDPAIESLRSLRTALQFAMLDAKNNIVLLTGPTPGIGKSFTSVNFAAVLGATNKSVLLIDTDMRKGHINQYFDLQRNRGLSELISGNISLEEAIHKNVLPGVDFISTGIIPPNPAELLLSKSAIDIINTLSEQYDLVLLDTTPVLAVSDSLALAPRAGTVFLLARSQITTLGEIEESVKRLRQSGSDVNGIVFNDLIPNNRRYASKYGSYRYAVYEYGQ